MYVQMEELYIYICIDQAYHKITLFGTDETQNLPQFDLFFIFWELPVFRLGCVVRPYTRTAQY
jgi:hypothetical protein